MRIALFTPFSPDIGGGSIQLKGLLPQLAEFDIDWYYLASAKAASGVGTWLGPQLMGGPLLEDLSRASRLWLRGTSRRIREIAAHMDADLYWIVAMNEGVLVALELCASGKPMHLTIHDDPVSVFQRSTRYRLLSPLMARSFSQLLRSARSVDVISHGMLDFYREKFGIESLVVYRYVQGLPRLKDHVISTDALRVGHIGIIYNAHQFGEFVEALRAHGRSLGVPVKLVKIGRSREFEKVQEYYPDLVEDLGELPEKAAIEELSKCNFLYSMYPDLPRFEVFRRTSQPMKLSTYIQAQRPIFAHTPEDSTLAAAVRKYRIGFVCPSSDRQGIGVALKALHQLEEIPRERFEQARTELLGIAQVRDLENTLRSSGMPFFEKRPTSLVS
jgi:glycosyltransferase involved in cell wall biosynthesis